MSKRDEKELEDARARLPFAPGDTYEAIASKKYNRHVEIVDIDAWGQVHIVVTVKMPGGYFQPEGRKVGIADAAYMVDKGFWRRYFR